MILVRNVFRLKFGKAREALALWQEGLDVRRRAGYREARVLTDLTGPFYTLVLETAYDSLSEMEREYQHSANESDWHAWYQRFVPLVESGYREVLNVVGAGAPPQAAVGARAETATTIREAHSV